MRVVIFKCTVTIIILIITMEFICINQSNIYFDELELCIGTEQSFIKQQ
jgi:hypothetical protein